jgi:lipoate---protein ligase
MIKTFKYCLPDIHLFDNKSNQLLIWTPNKTYIVLGASNQPEDSLHIENVKNDKITVLKRPSGGQTVVLTPNNLIISAVFFDQKTSQPLEVFHKINNLVISGLEELGIKNLHLKGISDIAINNKKIAGSAIYRNRNGLLYHAVLNLGETSATFEKYLKHPSKEPDYRKGRPHSEFITSLRENGCLHSFNHIKNTLSLSLNASFDL